MRVLIIPEDFRKDQYILKPIFRRLFRSIGEPRARIEVCQEPLLGGIDNALKSDIISEIVGFYPMTDIFILCVDRDGREGRRDRLDEIEADFGGTDQFLAVNAWEEIETWVLAGVALPNGWGWADVRAEIHVKEVYFEPFADQRGLSDRRDGGRKPLAEEAASRINVIRQKCPEDFDHLALRLSEVSG